MSGRTTVLKELKRRLEDNDWTCVDFTGYSGLSSVPLAAITAMRDDDPTVSSGKPGLQEAARLLQGLLRPARTVVLIDDADQLDEASAGLIGAVARETGTSIVSTTLSMTDPRQPLPFLGVLHGLQLALEPIGFDDLEEILRARHQCPVEIDTMSRVYAKSSGIVGVACAIVDAGILEKRILRRQGSTVLRAVENLWSPWLDSVVAMFVQPLGRVSQ